MRTRTKSYRTAGLSPPRLCALLTGLSPAEARKEYDRSLDRGRQLTAESYENTHPRSRHRPPSPSLFSHPRRDPFDQPFLTSFFQFTPSPFFQSRSSSTSPFSASPFSPFAHQHPPSFAPHSAAGVPIDDPLGMFSGGRPRHPAMPSPEEMLRQLFGEDPREFRKRWEEDSFGEMRRDFDEVFEGGVSLDGGEAERELKRLCSPFVRRRR